MDKSFWQFGLCLVGAVILFGIVIGGIGLYFWYSQQISRKRESEANRSRELEETRKRVLALLREEIGNIREAVDQFTRHTNLAGGYFSHHQISRWKEAYAKIFGQIKEHKLDDLELDPRDLETVRTFLDDYQNVEARRADYNKRFLDEESERYRGFFDTIIPGKKLDCQQRIAIETDEDNNLVIAGAGTGKTTTILGKVHYVIERYAVAPQEILLISFTNKSASDLATRIKIDGLEVKTFHKFGKDVIAEVEGRSPSIFNDNQMQNLVTRFFQESAQDSLFIGQVVEFFTEFLKRLKCAPHLGQMNN